MIDRRYRLLICCEAAPGGRGYNIGTWVDLEKLADLLGRSHGCLQKI